MTLDDLQLISWAGVTLISVIPTEFEWESDQFSPLTSIFDSMKHFMVRKVFIKRIPRIQNQF